MKYVKSPNLPQRAVTAAVVDGRINREIEAALARAGIEAVKTEPYPGIYPAISYHPDIMLHPLGEEYMVYAPGTAEGLLEKLRQKGFRLIKGQSELAFSYPENIAYNVCRIGRYAFHNMKYTDPVLQNELERRGVQLVHVKQGYAKCSISVIDESSLITSDAGIAKAAVSRGLEVLLIPPEEGILLYGLDYGFIGGSTGLIGRNRWAVTGNMDSLKSAEKICCFLTARGIEIQSLYDGPVLDIGTLIPIMEQG